MIEVSLSQLRAYIQAQPADRPHAINQSGFYCPIGSFLVHYGKDQGWEFNWMMFKTWTKLSNEGIIDVAKLKGESYWLSLFQREPMTSKKLEYLGTTYGDLQQKLL